MSLSGFPLREVAERIGISEAQLRGAEQPRRLRQTFTVQGAALAGLGERDIESLQQTYGSSFSLEIRLGDLTELMINDITTTAQLDEFLARLVHANPYEIVIELDKSSLLEQEVAVPEGWQAYWFLYAATLEEYLRRGVAQFESELWTDGDRRLLLLISDQNLIAHGPCLHVLGTDQLASLGEVFAEPEPDWSTVKRVRTTREKHISWEHIWVNHLTPLHFNIEISDGGDSTLGELLAAQIVKLTVLFTCDRARTRHRDGHVDEIRAEFRGQQYSTVVPIDEEVPLELEGDTPTQALSALVTWCYRRETGADFERDWTENRLPFVQTRFAEALAAVDENKRLLALVRLVPHMLEGLDWQWKAFIEDRVSEYLTKVRQLEDVVARTVSGFALQTSALTKGLSDAVLAAVGVLVGAFIAAAFADPFNAALFRVAVLVYGAYVILVPGVIGLSAQRGQMNVLKDEFGHQEKQFRSVMASDRIDGIVGERVEDAAQRFKFWFVIAVTGYSVLAVAAVVAALLVPDVIVVHSS